MLWTQQSYRNKINKFNFPKAISNIFEGKKEFDVTLHFISCASHPRSRSAFLWSNLKSGIIMEKFIKFLWTVQSFFSTESQIGEQSQKKEEGEHFRQNKTHPEWDALYITNLVRYNKIYWLNKLCIELVKFELFKNFAMLKLSFKIYRTIKSKHWRLSLNSKDIYY